MKSELKAKNFGRKIKSAFLWLFAFLIAVCVAFSVVPHEFLEKYAGKQLTSQIDTSLVEPFNEMSSFLPEQYQPHYALIASTISFILFVLSRLVNK